MLESLRGTPLMLIKTILLDATQCTLYQNGWRMREIPLKPTQTIAAALAGLLVSIPGKVGTNDILLFWVLPCSPHLASPNTPRNG